MSIATRINAIEEHIGNAYNKLEDLGIDLTGIDKNIDNIAEMLDTVYEDYPKVSATGTEVTLDGTKAGKLSLDVKGNSTQETTTGKNKLNLNRTETSYSTGVTLTETNFYKNLAYDGGVGTSNTLNVIDGSNIKVTSRYGQGAGFPIPCNASEKWTLTATRSDNDGNLCFVYFDENYTYLSNSGNYASDTLTATTPTNCKWLVALFNVKGSTSKQVTFAKVMLEKSSSATDFEPYTGGIASPNPSYPQPIYSAGDEYTELEYIESTGTQYINTGVTTGNNIKVQAKAISTFGFTGEYSKKYSGCLLGGRKTSDNSNFSYTSGINNDFVGSGSSFLTITRNANTDILDVEYSNTKIDIKCGDYSYINNLSINITDAFNIYIFALNQNNSATSFGTYKLYNFKIYNGTTLVRNFIPCKRNSDNAIGLYDVINGVFYTNAGTGTFTAGTEKTGFISEKIVNKNLFDEVVEMGGYEISSGIKSGGSDRFRNKNFITIKENTNYYLSYQTIASCYVLFYDKNKVYLSNQLISRLADNQNGGTFTTPTNAKYMNFYIINTDTTQHIILELGTTKTNYVAHQEQTYTIPCQQPMRSIGTVRDEFVKVNGTWYERHNIGEKIFTNDDSFGTQYSNTTRSGFFITIGNIKPYTNSNIAPPILSTKFISVSMNVTWVPGNISMTTYENTQKAVRFFIEPNKEISDLKAILLNQSLYYVLETPTDLPCTEEQIAILENLPKSYNEQTNIYSIDVTPAYIEAEALLDIENAIGGAY